MSRLVLLVAVAAALAACAVEPTTFPASENNTLGGEGEGEADVGGTDVPDIIDDVGPFRADANEPESDADRVIEDDACECPPEGGWSEPPVQGSVVGDFGCQIECGAIGPECAPESVVHCLNLCRLRGGDFTCESPQCGDGLVCGQDPCAEPCALLSRVCGVAVEECKQNCSAGINDPSTASAAAYTISCLSGTAESALAADQSPSCAWLDEVCATPSDVCTDLCASYGPACLGGETESFAGATNRCLLDCNALEAAHGAEEMTCRSADLTDPDLACITLFDPSWSCSGD